MNNSLSERLRKANAEFEELKRWAINETEKIQIRLKKEGIRPGLDTNREAYAFIHEEYKRRLLALFDKYDLPNKPNL